TNYSIRRYVFSDYCTCCHHSTFTQLYTLHNHGTRANPATITNNSIASRHKTACIERKRRNPVGTVQLVATHHNHTFCAETDEIADIELINGFVRGRGLVM